MTNIYFYDNITKNAPTSFGRIDMTDLDLTSQRFGVVVNPGPRHALERKVITASIRAFMDAARAYYRQHYCGDRPALDEAGLAQMITVKADVLGYALHLAGLLAADDATMALNASARDNLAHRDSADGLITMVCMNWIPQLPEIPLDDEAWGLFLAVTKAIVWERDPAPHLEAFVAHTGDDFNTSLDRARYFADHVAPELRVWLGHERHSLDVELPRI